MKAVTNKQKATSTTEMPNHDTMLEYNTDCE